MNNYFNLETIFKVSGAPLKFRGSPPSDRRVIHSFIEADYHKALRIFGQLKWNKKTITTEVWYYSYGGDNFLAITEAPIHNRR